MRLVIPSAPHMYWAGGRVGREGGREGGREEWGTKKVQTEKRCRS